MLGHENGDTSESSTARIDDLGHRLRSRRTAIGKTLQQVAKESGLTVGFISQIERGISTPSLASLYNVAQALESPVDHFLSHQPPRVHSFVSHAGERPTYKVGDTDRYYEFLERGFPDASLNACISHVPPGHQSEMMSHEGEDFVFLLTGKMEYEVEGNVFVLGPGDTLHFDAHKPHRCHNIGDGTATELWVGTMRLFTP